jgi:dTDP-4-amino-4,6-dideoxygalactose transaminase
LKIPFNKPFVIGAELENIAQAVREGHLSGDGPYTKRCHRWLEERLGAKRALLTHSCTAALEMAAILCDLAPGDEVIMPSFTFVSTTSTNASSPPPSRLARRQSCRCTTPASRAKWTRS